MPINIDNYFLSYALCKDIFYLLLQTAERFILTQEKNLIAYSLCHCLHVMTSTHACNGTGKRYFHINGLQFLEQLSYVISYTTRIVDLKLDVDCDNRTHVRPHASVPCEQQIPCTLEILERNT